MSEVVISYARSTAVQANAVADALRALGYDVWLDNDLPAHRNYSDVIDEQLLSAKAVVTLWSKEAVKSQWVRSEADTARKAGTLVQLSIDGALPPRPFDQIQCADMNGWAGDTNAPGWRKIVASVAELTVAAGTFSREAARTATDTHPTEPLLAVLAFDNLSGDPDMAYFSDGVSEEILHTVARSSGLKVIGRGSSFQFRGANKAAAHVATALNATHVLDGSVRRSGTKVRVAANLVECARQTTLWSDRFDRELSDVFALQDEIAAAVADALNVALTPARTVQKFDPAAYSLYLKARELWHLDFEADTRRSVIEMLEQATRLAPNFARGWEFLAVVLAERIEYETPDQRWGELREQVRHAAATALKLDPGLGAAYQALGQLEAKGDFAKREAWNRRALAASPNDATVLFMASALFGEVGREREALDLIAQAYLLDPLHVRIANRYGNLLDFTGQFERGRAFWVEALKSWPDNDIISFNCVSAAADRSDWDWFDTVVAHAREHGVDAPLLRDAIAEGQQIRNRTPEVRQRALDEARVKLARDGALRVVDYLRLHRIGLVEEAFEMIERSSFAYMFNLEQRAFNGVIVTAVLFSARYNSAMMHDRRFVRFCAKLGLVDYWMTKDCWPDCADAVPYDFRAEAKKVAAEGLVQRG